MQIFGVKQGVGRAGWEIWRGGRQEQKQKSFFWVYFGCLMEQRGCLARGQRKGFAGFGAVKVIPEKWGIPAGDGDPPPAQKERGLF